MSDKPKTLLPVPPLDALGRERADTSKPPWTKCLQCHGPIYEGEGTYAGETHWACWEAIKAAPAELDALLKNLRKDHPR